MYLQVDFIHNLYYETFGKEDGIPVLFIHGGPGLGFSKTDTRFFDPEKHFVIFYDQRGAGQSIPKGNIQKNTTSHLIEDIVLLLNHLEIDSCHIFGGSWGATLAVLFASKHPSKVRSVVLRGYFSATQSTINLYLKGEISGTKLSWERLSSFVPSGNEVALYYYNKITRGIEEEAEKYAYEWSRYGMSLSGNQVSEKEIGNIMNNLAISRDKIKLELHYALNSFFIDNEYVFQQAQKLNTPTTIIHGIHDYICPISDAEWLHNCISGSQLIKCDAGHSSSDKEIERALKKAVSNYS